MPFANLGPVKIHYLQLLPENDKGKTPPDVVFIHGLGANLGFWYFNIAPSLTDIARVTLFDLRGHGRSSMPDHGYRLCDMAADLSQLLDELDIAHPHLVGHSLGGGVMAEFAAMHPQRAASLMFVDARLKLFQPTMTLADWPHWENVGPLLDAMGIVLKPEEGEVSYQLLREIARLQWLEADRGDELIKRLSGSLLAGFTFTGAGGRRSAGQLLKLLESTTALAELSREDNMTTEQLRAIRCPVAAVYGGASQTLATQRALKDLWPHLQNWLIPDAGHFFPTTKPEALCTALHEFYKDQF